MKIRERQLNDHERELLAPREPDQGFELRVRDGAPDPDQIDALARGTVALEVTPEELRRLRGLVAHQHECSDAAELGALLAKIDAVAP